MRVGIPSPLRSYTSGLDEVQARGATLVGLLLFESGGGVLVLAAWLAAAVVVVVSRSRATALAASV